MHNLKEQLGYYNNDLNTFVYHDNQMGNVFSDIWGSITGGVSKTIEQRRKEFEDSIKHLAPDLREAAMKRFLETGTGVATVEEAKKNWIEQQIADAQAKARVFYVENKNSINTALAVTAVALTGYIVYRSMSGRKAAPAAANPRRRRRKSKRSR